jgi:hypothetical protein
MAAGFAELLFFGVERGCPEDHALVEVVDIDDEVT